VKALNSDEIIKMSSQELFEYVEEQLELNPVLEQGELDEVTDEAILSLTDNTADDEGIEDEDGERIDMITAADITIKEHLIAQLNVSSMDKKQKTIGEYIVDNIDENGYMLIGTEEIAAYFGLPEEYIDGVLKRLQSFDPPGVCARNLKECLTIQMKQLGTSNEDIKAFYLDPACWPQNTFWLLHHCLPDNSSSKRLAHYQVPL
jgi:RNA polymerase sigma-54 factor